MHHLCPSIIERQPGSSAAYGTFAPRAAPFAGFIIVNVVSGLLVLTIG
ncbi:hypothetical protein PQI51_03655 [Microbacterium esteraromaticum]